jgi:hypothetical protein
VSIIVEPVTATGTLDYDGNCYLSLDYANDFLKYLTGPGQWSGVGKSSPSDDDKERLLITATRGYLEPLFATQQEDRFDNSTPQPLMFPRSWDRDPSTGYLWVPHNLRRGTAFLAVWLWEREQGRGGPFDATRAQEQGIKSFDAGSISVRMGKGYWRYWPAEVKALVAPYWNRDGRTTEGPTTQLSEIFVLPGFGPKARWPSGR